LNASRRITVRFANQQPRKLVSDGFIDTKRPGELGTLLGLTVHDR
jgi:hypothetical protein